MLGGLEHETSVEALRRLDSRDSLALLLEVLPLGAVQDALASGAARAIQRMDFGKLTRAPSPSLTVAAKLGRARPQGGSTTRHLGRRRAGVRGRASLDASPTGLVGQRPHAIVLAPGSARPHTVENQVGEGGPGGGERARLKGDGSKRRVRAFERVRAEAQRQGEDNLLHGDKRRRTWGCSRSHRGGDLLRKLARRGTGARASSEASPGRARRTPARTCRQPLGGVR